MTVKVLGLREDPDTEKALSLLVAANITYELVDVATTGIAGFLQRDLDVRELPVVLSWNGKVEGLKAIAAFAQQPR
jgi:hypothetical protein